MIRNKIPYLNKVLNLKKSPIVQTPELTKHNITSELKRYVRARIASVKSKTPKTPEERAKQSHKISVIINTWDFMLPFNN